MNSTDNTVKQPHKVEVVSPDTAGAILPFQAERITELKTEVTKLKNSRIPVGVAASLFGASIGWTLAVLLMPPRQEFVQVEKPIVVEKPVTIDRWCLVGCK